jgi:hypothetical protein
MEGMLTALILGLSPERFFMCPCLTLGLALSERTVAVRFLLGRITGIITLGCLFTLAGFKSFPIDKYIINIFFGVLVIIFGVSIFLRKPHEPNHKLNSSSGFGLGLYRGLLIPGKKMILLLPLLVGVNVFNGLFISAVYAVSSSFYLLLGFWGGDILNRAVPYRKVIKISGAVILITLGIFYLAKGVLK